MCGVASAQQVKEQSVDNSHDLQPEDVNSDGKFALSTFLFSFLDV